MEMLLNSRTQLRQWRNHLHERNLTDSGKTHEWPARQRGEPTMLTYDTLGTPSFHQPFAHSTTHHTAGVTS